MSFFQININIYNLLIITGSIQGLIFSALILFNPRYKSNSNLYLSLLIVAISLNNLYYWFIDINYIEDIIRYRLLYIPWALLIIPMYYYFVNSYLQGERKKLKKLDLIFYPFYLFYFLHLTLSISLYRYHLDICRYQKLVQYLYFFEEYFSAFFTLITIYIIYKKIKAYEEKNDSYEKRKVKKETKWLKNILIFGVIICLIWLLMILYNNINSLPLFSNKNRYFLWISNSFLIYYIGYLGIYYNGVFKQRTEIRKKNTTLIKEFIPKNNKIENIKKSICKEKAFLDPSLNLYYIAKKYHLNESYLSQLFNKNNEINFPTYINNLRVEESKKLLVNKSYENYDINSIGLESGFNSKSAFYNAFKKITGLTPTQYRRRNLSR